MNIFFSNQLYEIYQDVFSKGKKVELQELYNVLKDEVSNIEYDYGYFYNSKKYFCSPGKNIIRETYSTNEQYKFYRKFNELFDMYPHILGNEIYQNEQYFIVEVADDTKIVEPGYENYNNTIKVEYFFVYKEYNESAINSLKAIAEGLEEDKSVFGAKYLVYSNKYDHPVGFAIRKDIIKFYQNKINLRSSDLKEPNKNQVIPIIKLIFDELDDLFFEYNCTLKKLELENIFCLYNNLHSKVIESILFTNICDLEKRDEEYNIDILKVNIVLDVLNEFTSYNIVENKIIFTKEQKILAFSATVIEMYKEYLLTGNISDNSIFLEAIDKTISNYVQDGDIYYYKGYGFNPYNVDMKFKDQVVIKDDEELIPISCKNSANSYLSRIKNNFNKLKNRAITIINDDSYELVWDKTIDKADDVYNFYGVLCKKCDDKVLYKLSDIKTLYYNGIINNKQLVENILKILELFDFGINIKILYFSEDLQICIPASYCIINLLNDNLFPKNDKRKVINDRLKSEFKDVLVKLQYMDYDENIDSWLLRDKLRNNLFKLNTKCSTHNFWYNDKTCCSLCYPNSIIFHKDDLKSFIRSTDKYTEYSLLIKNDDCTVKLFNGEEKELELILDQLSKEKDNFSHENKILLNLFSFKKVLSEKSMKFIGYAIKSICPINKFNNKELLECLYNFIRLIKEMDEYGIIIDGSNLYDVIGFDKHYNPVVNDITYIKKSSISISKSSAILNFISSLLDSCHLSNKQIIKNISQCIELGNFDDALALLAKIKKSLDGCCKKHNHYFSLTNHECCQFCFGVNTKVYSLSDVTKCEVFSDIGKEAVVYDLGDGMLGKVYRTNQKGEFENELDINQKEQLIKSLIAKVELKNSIKQGRNFEIVDIKGIIVDDCVNFRGIIIEKKTNVKPIKILTDKAQIKKYSITREDVFKMLISIGYAIEFCHKNQIYIGDLSYNNILFELDTKTIYLIDIDSVSLKRNNNTVFTDIFVDPLSISKNGYAKTSFEADWYAYSILCFYVLTLLHPFNGIYRDDNEKIMPMQKRKVKRISVLGKHNVKIPPIALDWNEFISSDLKECFLDIFEREKRYNITKQLEKNFEKNFFKEEVLDEKELVVKEDKMEFKTQTKKATSLNLKAQLVAQTDKSDRFLISKEVFVEKMPDFVTKYFTNEDRFLDCYNFVYNGTNKFEFSSPIENIYVCNKDLIYVKTHRQLHYCYKNIQCSCLGFYDADSFIGSSVFPIPYSKEILGVTQSNSLVSIKAGKDGAKQMIIKEFSEKLPNLTLSINSRYGNNNYEEISSYYLETLNFLITCDDKTVISAKECQICVDLILDKWLIISDKVAYVFNPKTIKADKVNIAYDKLQDIVMKNIIFFKDSIYYPVDGKICSLDLFDFNYLEFKCDKVVKNSRIEIIKDGFRVFNQKNVYDLVKN